MRGQLLAWCCLAVGLGGYLFNITTRGADKPTGTTSQRLFRDQVQPLLKARCGECHNPNSSKAELDLTTIAGMKTGGESGDLVVAGKPNNS